MSDYGTSLNKSDYSANKNLYKFLATSYDISTLAGKIRASEKSDSGILNLKKMVKDNDIATA